jgi:hypothetical protein
MQLSDPRFVAQAVHPVDGPKAVFEEMGCGVIWMEENSWENYAFYVADLKTGKWLKFDEALFTVEYVTPMSFGIAALTDIKDLEADKMIITKDAALTRIKTTFAERQANKMNMHGAN